MDTLGISRSMSVEIVHLRTLRSLTLTNRDVNGHSATIGARRNPRHTAGHRVQRTLPSRLLGNRWNLVSDQRTQPRHLSPSDRSIPRHHADMRDDPSWIPLEHRGSSSAASRADHRLSQNRSNLIPRSPGEPGRLGYFLPHDPINMRTWEILDGIEH